VSPESTDERVDWDDVDDFDDDPPEESSYTCECKYCVCSVSMDQQGMVCEFCLTNAHQG